MTLAAHPYRNVPIEAPTSTDITIIDQQDEAVYVSPNFADVTEFARVPDPLRWMDDDFLNASLGLASAGAVAAINPWLDQVQVLAWVETKRRGLGWSADRVADLAGRSKRRYHEWLGGERAPDEQLAAVLDGMTLVCEYADRDPWTTKVLFDSAPEMMQLVKSRDRDGLTACWNDMRQRLSRVDAGPKTQIAELLRTPDAVAAPGDVAGILALLEAILPAIHAAREAWRVTAFQDLAKAIDQLESSNSVSSQWAFLAVLDDDQMDAFRLEAASILSSELTQADEWRAWLAAAVENAYSAVTPIRYESIEGDAEGGAAAAEPTGTEILDDIRRMGISLVVPRRAGR